MTTLRGRKSFALSCLLTLLLSHAAADDAEFVPVGRRREKASSQAPDRFETPPVARPVPTEPVLAEGVRPENPRAQVTPAQTHVDPLLQLAQRAIDKTSQRYLDADEHTPWQIMHGVVALRRDFDLLQGGERINCIEYLSNAPTFRGEHWFQATPHGGRAHPFSVAYAFEGHANQFLALLSMSNLPLTHRFTVAGGRIVTMADMVRNAKMTVNDREEITWTLWFLTHYLDIDAEWTNENGEPWSLEELVRLQTDATVTNAPCGGTHGLFAIAYARNAFLRKHGRLHGVYFQADQKIQRHIELARSLQNHDGSFSSDFFKGPGHSRDFNERLKASGHMLEWLMMALPQRRLSEAWIRRAVASISTDLIHNAAQPAKCGPLYHALNSLIMYRDRVKPPATPSKNHARPELVENSPRLEERREEIDSQPAKPLRITPTPKLTRQSVPEDAPATSSTAISKPGELLPPDDLEDESPARKPNRLAHKAGKRLAEIAIGVPAEPEPPAPLLLLKPRRIAIEPGNRSQR